MNNLTCDNCGKTFSNKSNLNVHKRTVNCKSREIPEITTFECKFCNKIYNREYSCKRHQKICNENTSESKDSIIEKLKAENLLLKYKIDKRDRQIKTQHKTINKLKKENETLKQRTIDLDKDISYGKGQIHVLENVKPSKISKITNNTNNNCNMSSKVQNIQITTIKPFTIEAISELLPQYTFNHFLNKLNGILSIILPFTVLDVDGVIERNIVCTDLARTVCHYLNNERLWTSDNGLTVCSEIINLFTPQMAKYIDKLNDEFILLNRENQLYEIECKPRPKGFVDKYRLAEEIKSEMTYFYIDSQKSDRKEHLALVKTFRDMLKPKIHINFIYNAIELPTVDNRDKSEFPKIDWKALNPPLDIPKMSYTEKLYAKPKKESKRELSDDDESKIEKIFNQKEKERKLEFRKDIEIDDSDEEY